MKPTTTLASLCTTLLLVFSPSAFAAGTLPKKEAGPNGGRLITSVVPHAEFFVTADRKVQITFVGENGQPVAPAAQVVTVTAGERAAPTRLAFARTGDVLLSDGMLPAGNDFPTVVQIKPTPDARPVTERFNLNLAICSGCKLGEYACTCEGHGDDSH